MRTTWNIGKAMANLSVLTIGLLTVLSAHAADAVWQIENVDTSGLAEYTSLKIDASGNVHVVYSPNSNGSHPLKYAFRDHVRKRWFVMTVDNAASFCSLALDSKGRPHISYADPGTVSGTKLRYAYWDGESWRKQAVPLQSEVVGYYTSIALDQNDRPSITFYEYRGAPSSEHKNRLRNALWNGRAWEIRTIDGEFGSGKFNCIASDPSGHMHVAYANVGQPAGIRYAYWNGSTWSVNVLEQVQQTQNYVGHSACLTVDKDSNPHLTYMDATNRHLKYATRKDNRWMTQTVDAMAGQGYPDRNSITLDAMGRPYLGYYDTGRGVLKIAYTDGQRWLSTVVDGNGAGFTSSVQIYDDELWVSYADPSIVGLKVARISLSDMRRAFETTSSLPVPPPPPAKER